MYRPDSWPLHPDIIRMVIGGFRDDELEDTPFVTVELVAADADAAERFAQEFVAVSLRDAGLKTHLFPVAWVAPLSDESENSHRFLEQAKDLYGSEEFDLAIVAAQIHFELQLRLLLERAASRADNQWATRLVKNRRVAALANDVSKASVQLLLGVDVAESRYWARIQRPSKPA